MAKPRMIDDDAYRALRTYDMETFKRLTCETDTIDYSNADLRGCDFRNVDLAKIVILGAYLKEADLRGCDLRRHDLSGCSLHNAKIGGAWFPEQIHPQEIMLSVQHGTRIRITASTDSTAIADSQTCEPARRL